MNYKLFFSGLFLLFLTFSFSAHESFSQTSKNRPRAKIRGENFSYKLFDEDFARVPVWDAEAGDPPVSINRAVNLAKTNLPRFVQNSDNFKIRRILLREYANTGKWFYDISFVCRDKSCRDLSVRHFNVLVKMNEEIIEPKILPPDF